MKGSTKTSINKPRTTASKISKAPARASSRIAAKNVALKMERNSRPEKSVAKKSTRSPKSPKRNEKDIDKMQTDPEIKNNFEFNESYRDNPLTTRNNQKSFLFTKNQLDSYKCQMAFAENFIDCYPKFIRTIENSDNDLAVKALHHVEKTRYY